MAVEGTLSSGVVPFEATARAPADLAEFCRREHPRLVGTLGLYTGDADLAEELAQDALLRACRDWEKVRHFAAPGAWVHRVAINLANSAFRSRAARRRAVRRLESQRHGTLDADGAADLALRAAVAGLPANLRAVLVLRYYADLPVREVASVLSCPEGTVKTLTSRALARLRGSGIADLEVTDGD